MRRAQSRSAWMMSAAVLGGLGWWLWLTSPVAEDLAALLEEPCPPSLTEEPSAGAPPVPARPRLAALSDEDPVASGVFASLPAASPPASATRSVFTPSRASVSGPGEVSLPPAASRELASDGLPAAATDCHWEGNVLRCGSCQSSADCPQNQGCLINRETRRLECMASECEEDAHCFPGYTCREARTGTSNAAVRRCMPVGERAEGESCDPDYISRSGACREGLRCLNQVCTRPCRLEDPTSCPSGHTCTQDADGPGCVPDCEQLGCPTGQRCKHLPRGGNRCLARVTGTCPETPCAQGERCLMDGGRGRGAFWCARDCEPLRPESCGAGQVCGWAGGTASACFRQCDPKRIDSCGEGWMCATVSEDLSLWGCRPSAWE